MRTRKTVHYRLSLFLLSLLTLTLGNLAQAGAFERLFAPKAELWVTWQQHQPGATATIDHAAWDRFLQKYVQTGGDGINRIPYASVTPADKQTLVDYISAMQAVAIHQYNRPQQMAYWINLYNAVTVNVVLDHYPVDSIRDIDISPGFFADGPWGKKLLSIEGEAVSLNDIEHRILRPIWKDPRIHYAVNCASLGCPNLRKRAYTAATLDSALTEAAHNFTRQARAVRVDGKDVYVSSIYSWFQEDFGTTEAEVIRHIQAYAEPGLASQLEGIEFFAGDSYDWSLNDASPGVKHAEE